MRVAELMRNEVKSVLESQAVGDALTILVDNHISGLPVVNSHGSLIGVVTAADVLEALAECADGVARETLLNETLVSDLMTPRPQTITPDATVKDAAQQMLYLEVHRLFVEQNGKLVGVISTTDLVRGLAMMPV
jgi:CBS domain-containing protein